MKIFCSLLAILSILLIPLQMVGAQVPCADFEIVESIPVETTLDNPDIRNAPEVWVEMINGAKKTLDIEQFYISTEPGGPLEAVLEAIEKAASRGVKVRLIADSKMYKTYPESVDRLNQHKNIESRVINFARVGSGSGVQHAKFFIVDRQTVFLGSQNFDWRALKHIHEIGVRIHHAQAAAAIEDLFELDWNLCQAKTPEEAQGMVSQKEYALPFTIARPDAESILFSPVWAPAELSPNADQWSLKALLDKIQSAQHEVCIELLTYSPIARSGEYWPELEVALRSAAAKGVKVRLIVADWCKTHPKIDYLKSLALVPNIEVKLSTIPPASTGHIPYARVTHAKFMTVDGQTCWIGCSNWQKEYYYNTRDVGVIVQSSEVTSVLNRIFRKDWESDYTYLIQPEVDYTPPHVGE